MYFHSCFQRNVVGRAEQLSCCGVAARKLEGGGEGGNDGGGEREDAVGEREN